MRFGTPGSVGRAFAAVLLLATTLVVAVAPKDASAASFTAAPTRLYMAPTGTTLVAELVGVPLGVLNFDGGTDVISQQVRTITVDTLTGTSGCDLSGPPYDIDDCSRLQLSGISHGRISMGAITTVADGQAPGVDAHLLPSGARIDQPYQVAEGSFTLGLNGTPQQLNDSLAALVYTPDTDYHFDGSNGETLNIVVVPGTSDDPGPEDPPGSKSSATAEIQIRVLDVNDFPNITSPSNKAAQPGVELLIPSVTPSSSIPYTGTEFTVTDPDNDENVDGAQANPSETEDPLPDGADDKMLLVAHLNCGTPTVDLSSGFHLRGGTFQLTDNDIESLVQQFFGFASLPQAAQDAVTALLAAVEAIEPGLTTTMLASNDPTDFTSLFAAIGTMSEVQFALSQITFLQPAENDTCVLSTAVSDLGNNGLPLQYIGAPPTGQEVPFIGLDISSFDITTGALEEIDVSFDGVPIVVDEAAAPVPAQAVIHISPPTHPAFTIRWDAIPLNGAPVVTGLATANSDFGGTSNNTLLIAADETMVTIDTNVFPDSADEGPETFSFDLVLTEPAPPGFSIVSATPTQTVLITDDDDGPPSVASITGETLAEGNSGTAAFTFTVTLDGPADGGESVEVSTADLPAGPGAAVAGSDYTAISGQVVTFAAGATTATVDVLVTGDTDIESDESFRLTLANPSGLGNVGVLPQGESSIVNDDQASVISIADTAIDEDAGTSVVVVSMTNFAGRQCAVSVTTGSGTATSGVDFPAISGATFNVINLASDNLPVSVTDDGLVEGPETFTITLALLASSDDQCQLGDNQATITITDDDVASVISIADTSIDEDAGTAVVVVSMTNFAGRQCAVSVTTGSGTATSGVDFPAISGATFNVINLASDNLPVSVTDDGLVEGPETFTITLALLASSDDQCQLGDNQATITITDDDVASVISIADTSIDEDAGTAVVVVSMTNFAGRQCAVSVTTGSGTATSGVDFPAISGATFNVINLASDNLPVSVTDDGLVEGPETFTITLALLASSDDQCQLGDNQATITIVDDDVASVISIVDTSIDEDAGTAVVVVSMTNFAGRQCAVSVTTGSGTATSGVDFPAISGATFNVINLASDNLPVSVTDDGLVEGPETFTITLALLASSDDQCQLGDNQATITIVDDDVASVISIADTSIDEDAGTAVVVVSMTNFAGRQCAVSVTTGSGTATSGVDFPAISGATFNVINLASDNLPVSVTDDGLVEGPETFTITLALLASSDDQCQLGDNQATITIVDDDVASVISIADTSIDEDAGTAVVVVSMTNFAGRQCAVSVTTGSGTATSGVDFPAISGATFNVINLASDNLPVSVTDDGLVEGPETFTITLALLASSDDQCQLGDNQATITIVDDDVASVISIADTSIDEDAGTAVVVVSMTNFAGRQCAVSVTTGSGTATSGVDFPAISGATFNVINLASDNLPVSVTDDGLVEGPETFTITLALLASSDDQCQLGDNQATITITDDDVASVISIADTSIDEDAGTAVVVVSMTNFAGRQCAVSVTTGSGTATSGVDFPAISGATFNVINLASDNLPVSVTDDGLVEGPETFTITLALLASSDDQCQLGDNQATITITDDDVASVISIADTSIDEDAGTAVVVVSMTNFAGRQCAVSVTTGSGTATSGVDFPAISGATFNVINLASDNLPVSVNDDGLVEGPETFTITLALLASSDDQCQLGDNQATITITDDDVADVTPPTVAVEQAAGQADPATSLPIMFTVTFSEPVTGFTEADVIVTGSAIVQSAPALPLTDGDSAFFTASASPGFSVSVSGSGAQYTVAVGQLSTSGTVVVTLAPGAAFDGALNPSVASTSGDNQVSFVAPATGGPEVVEGPTTNAGAAGGANAAAGSAGSTVGAGATATAVDLPPPTVLAITGADSATLSAIGASLILTGIALARIGDRRRRAA